MKIALGNQVRQSSGFATLSEILFPDLAGVVDGVLCPFVRIVQLIEGLLVFHAANAAPILRVAQGAGVRHKSGLLNQTIN